MLKDEDIDSIIKMTTALLKAEYQVIPEVTDSMLQLIDAMASLVETNYIGFDSEFKTILYMWEYEHVR